MSELVSVVLVGIGGYGGTYCSLLLNQGSNPVAKIVGVVDPFAEKASFYAQLKEKNIPFYNTLTEFYQQHKAELAVISTPISLHCPQTCEALEHGSNVLCEKPLCALISEAEQMLAARERAGLQVAIGYQWSFSSAMRALKADILSGRLGQPKRLKTIALWPRKDSYYARNNWAGALQNARGEWVLDSPANNACAHYLHNMFFLLGATPETSVGLKSVQAELYRANAISNYDTCIFRVATASGAEVLFYSTHACGRLLGPVFEFEFTKATVNYARYASGTLAEVTARFQDGSQKLYGFPDADGVSAKLWDTIRAVRGQGKISCGIETAMMQTICINAAMQSCPEIKEFPPELVYKMGVPGAQVKVMTGLAEYMEQAYHSNQMLAEVCSEPWVQPGKVVSC